MKKLSVSLFAVMAIVFAVSSAFTSARFDYSPQAINEIFTAANLVDPGASSGDESAIEAAIDNSDLTYRGPGIDLEVAFDDFTYRQHCVESEGSLCGVAVEWSTTGTSVAIVVAILDYEVGDFVVEL